MANENQSDARKLEAAELEAALESPLEDEVSWLKKLVPMLGSSDIGFALFDRLHAAAGRDSRVTQLSEAYGALELGDGLTGLPAEQRAEFFVHASTFSWQSARDRDRMVHYAEQALAASDGAPSLLVRLDSLFVDIGEAAQLASLYGAAAAQGTDVERQVRLLEHAVRMLDSSPDSAGFLLPLKDRVVRLRPTEHIGWLEELQQGYESSSHHRELVELLEAALGATPPLSDAEARPLRLRLARAYQQEVLDRARSLVHLEALASLGPLDEEAVHLAEPLLEQKVLAPRVAALLSDAYAALGRAGDEIASLTMELKLARPPRLGKVQRRLASLRQEYLDDAAGALELLEPLVTREPGDDDVRRRYLEASAVVGHDKDAARLLSRVIRNVTDDIARARVGLDVGCLQLRTGDDVRARATFEQVLDTGVEDPCVVEAARRLLEQRANLPHETAARALAMIASRGPNPESRRAAAIELLDLAHRIRLDRKVEIMGWRAMLDSPREPDALLRLEALYQAGGDDVGLSEVLERRAAFELDPGRAHELAFRSADLRSGQGTDVARALEAWRRFIAHYGTSRSVHAKLIPLLERSGAFAEVATTLAEEAALASEIERAGILARLAEVRLRHLEDVPGALEAARQSLELDPSEPRSRALLEELFDRGETGAMDPLEPICASEYSTSARASDILVRILESRAKSAGDARERAGYFARLGNVLDCAQLAPDPSLAACGRALAEIAKSASEQVEEWLARVERLAAGQSSKLAALLLSVLTQDGIDVAVASTLSVAAARALEASGQLGEALAQYQRALEQGHFSAELLEQADALACRAGHSALQRIARYRTALQHASARPRRADILHAMARLELLELHDTGAAIATWRRVFEADPGHWPSHEALLGVFKEKGDASGLERELRRAMQHFEGHQRRLTAVRLAEALAGWGRKEEAIALCAPLVSAGIEDEDLLEMLERVAIEAEDTAMLLRILERRVAAAAHPADRARAHERVGDFFADWHTDPQAAARCWIEAARQHELPGGAPTEAARLYERALSASVDDPGTAARLVELYSEHGDWARVPEAFAALQRGTNDPAKCADILLSIEERAIRGGAANEFSDLVGALLWGATQSASPWARALVAAKARVYAGVGRYDEAADVFRTLLESSSGEPAEGDVQQFEALLEISPDAEWRRQNLRWLYEWRVDRSADPASLLLRWAEIEERDFGDPQTAIALLDRAAARDPKNGDVLDRQIRLRLDTGDIDGGLESLRRLREVATPEKSRDVILRAATLLGTPEHGEAALTLIQGLLDIAPTDPDARQLTFQLLHQGSPIREHAAELLERVSSVADSTEDHRHMLEKLLDTAIDHDNWEDSPSARLKELRRRWFERMLRLTQGKSALAIAERGAAEFPQEEPIWQVLEPLAVELGDPQAVVRAYQRALGQPIGPELAERLGRRLLTFAEERAIDPAGLTVALERVLALAPGARWALDRVKLALSLEQRWPALFGLYDRAVQAAEDDREKMDLLDEAAVAARDVVGDLDRAIGYWEQLFALRTQDARVDMVLERLYERRGQIDRLIAHLSHRVGSVAGISEQRGLRRRIAGLWLDLGQAEPAFDLVEGLLSEDPDDEAGYELLERILVLQPPPDSQAVTVRGEGSSSVGSDGHRRTVRLSAQRLRQRYLAQERTDQIGRVLQAELAACDTKGERAGALAELFEHRLTSMGDKAGALGCLGELVLLEPKVASHRIKLTELAEELQAYGELCNVLVAAAGHSDDAETAAVLLQQAAELAVERLSDPERAAELYHRVLYGEGDSAAQLTAGRALEQLQKGLGRSAERCDVLERLSLIEPNSALARELLVEAARVAAEELNDPLRAARGLQRVLREQPADRAVLDTLIEVLRAGESWSELCEALASRVRLNRQGAEPRQDLAEIARVFSEKLSDPDRAIEIWRLVRRRFGDDVETMESLAGLLEHRQRWGELASFLSEWANTAIPPEPVFARLARVHRDNTGDLPAAIVALLGACEWASAAALWEANCNNLGDDAQLAARLVGALREAQCFAEAESVLRRQLERVERRSPKERAMLFCDLAEVIHAAGRPDDAIKELSSALALFPSDPRILGMLGRIGFEHGDLDKAEQSYRMLLLVLRRSDEGGDTVLSRAEVYVELSEIASHRGDADAARDYMASAFEVSVDSRSEALGLERALRQSQKPELLERALDRRIEHALDACEAVRALESLLEAAGARVESDPELARRVLEHADRIWTDLAANLTDPAFVEGARVAVAVFRRLRDGRRAAEALSCLASHTASPEERQRFELDVVRELLALPTAREEAVARLRTLVEGDPAHDEAFSLLCGTLEEDGRREDLLALIRARLDSDLPGLSADAVGALRLRMASLFEQLGRVEDAIAVYEELEKEPGAGHDALRAIARLEEARGAEPARIASILGRLLLREHGPARAALALRILALRGEDPDFDSAERILSVGFAADPTHPELRDRLVRTHTVRDDWEKAAAVLEQSVQAVPDDASLRLQLADVRCRQGDTEGALRALAFVPGTEADRIEVGRRRCAVLQAAGSHEEALVELEAIASLDGTYASELLAAIEETGLIRRAERWAMRAVDLILEQGDHARARAIIDEWLAREPDNLPCLRRAAAIATRQNDWQAANQAYGRLLRLEEPSARTAVALELARVCEQAELPCDALEPLEQALAEAPADVPLRRKLRALYAKMGARRKEAQLLLEEASRDGETQAKADRLLEASDLLLRDGAFEEALDAVLKLRTMVPDRVEAVVLYSRILVAEGRPAEALAELKQFIHTHAPRASKAVSRLYRQIADIHLAADELVEAFDALGQAHRMNKGEPEVAFTLGLLAVDLDELDVANSALRTFVAIKGEGMALPANDGPSPASQAYCHLAWIEYAKGHHAAARRMASRAVEDGQQNRDAHQLLEKLTAS